MIIQCEKCQAKFRLDDSKITDKGVKVRCAKCKYVFTVRKEEPDANTVEIAEPMAFATTSETGNATTAAHDVAASEPSMFGDVATPNVSSDFGSFETSSFDASAISFDSDESTAASEISYTADAALETATKAGEIDFSGFDFSDAVAEPDTTAQSTLSIDDFGVSDEVVVSTPALPQETPQGLDFSDDDMFGAVVQQAAPETPTESISFDFEDDSFAESMDMGSQDSAGKSNTLFSLDAPQGETPFNLGEIDFGDELTSVAVQQVNPEDLKPSQEMLFAPIAESHEKTSADVDLTKAFIEEETAVTAAVEHEPPPLSIASRRKQSPLFSGFMAVIAFVAVSVLGYLGYSTLSAPKGSSVAETGKISVRSVKAAFIKNSVAGELLVISGDAFNEYSKPRAALQLQATVFDATGQAVATKSAYGGNPLTDKQLESMPLDKIEAAMSNQFGDSLANMEVPPGKAIPFVVVLANLPKGAKDFAVQSAGSTVATGKQQ